MAAGFDKNAEVPEAILRQGFGFTGDWERGAWKSARLLGASPGRILVEADHRRVVLKR